MVSLYSFLIFSLFSEEVDTETSYQIKNDLDWLLNLSFLSLSETKWFNERAFDHLQQVQNLIVCSIQNIFLANRTTNFKSHMKKIFKKFLQVSEFNFSLLPDSKIFIMKKPTSSESIQSFTTTLIANLLSSIPEWPEKIMYRKLWKDYQ